MADLTSKPHSSLRPSNTVEWIALITSTIADVKGVDWFSSTTLTIKGLCDSINNDSNFSKTVTDAINLKLNASTYTAADILAKLKTVDGDTSGLDADTVKGYVPVNKTGDTMTGLLTLSGDPTNPLHAATKQYVDNAIQGLDIKASVKVATTANITLSGVQTIDGVALVAGDRVLVKDQTTKTQNGLYVVASGAWTRTTDADGTTSDLTSGSFVFVEMGTVNADSGWVVTTNGTITLGTTDIVFVQFSGAGQITAGTGLGKNGNTLYIADLWTDVALGTGIFTKVTINKQGQVIAGSNPTTLAGYGITDGVNTSDVVTTATANKILRLDTNAKLPASITGNADGNAGTATKLQTPRKISISTDATGNATFDGSADITIALTLADTGVTAGTYTKVTVDSKGRVTTGTTLSASDIPNLDWSKITTGKPTTLSGYGITDGVNTADVVTTATANKILKLDSNAKLPASITGNADGNAATATKLQTSRKITVDTDMSGNVTFDGSADVTLSLTLASTGVTAGTYTKVTVDAKGRVTSATTLAAADIPNLDWSKITTGKPTTLAGYGITDGVNTSDVVTTATANKILKLDSNAKLPASITGDADSVDGLQGNIMVVDRGADANDWNTLLTPGVYKVGRSAWTGTLNTPGLGDSLIYAYGTLLVITSGTAITQVYFTHKSTNDVNTHTGMWVRTKWNASDWNAWIRYWTDGNTGIGSGLNADKVDGADVNDSGIDTASLWTASKIITELAKKLNTTETVTTATANKILYLDSNAKLPASITGNADGNAATATKLQTGRKISIASDATGNATFDGTTDITINITLKNSGVTAGTYTKVTVDAQGRVTAGTTLSASDIPNLDWSKITTGKPTTLAGYGITDGLNKGGDTMTGGFLTLYQDPTDKMHAATKGYVDSVAQGLDVKLSVKAATTANIDLTAGGTITVDGVALAVNNRVLVKDQTTKTQNGIYIVQTGAWTRATDAADGATITPGMFMFVEQGTINAETGWVLSSDGTVTVGTTDIVFTQFTGAGEITPGTGLSKNGNTLSITDLWTDATLGTGVFTKVTVNKQGQVIAGTTLSASDIPNLDWSKITTGKPNSLSGYGILDGVNTSDVVATATANKILKLDTNAKLPASITGNADGNAATSSKWANGRKITLSTGATGNVTIDGSADVTLAVTVVDDGHLHTKLRYIDKRDVKPADTPTGYSRNYFASLGGLTGVADTVYQDLMVLNTYIDGSGGKVNALAFDKSAMVIRHYQAAQADTTWGTPKTLAYTSDNVASASKLATPRSISLSTDVTGSASFDGSGDITIVTTLSTTGVAAGTYRSVTVDTKGRVTAGTNPTTVDGYGLTDAVKKTGDTMSGYLGFNNNLAVKMKDSAGNWGAQFIAQGDDNFVFYISDNTGAAKSLFVTAMNKASRDFAFQNIGNLTVNSYKVWHAGNMGTGSTLDADKVDGLEASSFLRSDQDTTTNYKINAASFSIGGKVSLQYNTTQNSLDIVFS